MRAGETNFSQIAYTDVKLNEIRPPNTQLFYHFSFGKVSALAARELNLLHLESLLTTLEALFTFEAKYFPFSLYKDQGIFFKNSRILMSAVTLWLAKRNKVVVKKR